MEAGPEMRRLISQFEECLSGSRNADDRHHVKSVSIQRDLIDKVKDRRLSIMIMDIHFLRILEIYTK